MHIRGLFSRGYFIDDQFRSAVVIEDIKTRILGVIRIKEIDMIALFEPVASGKPVCSDIFIIDQIVSFDIITAFFL